MVSKKCESVDTNIVLRMILRDNLEQYGKVQGLLGRTGVSYHVSDLAITETVYTLQKVYGWTREGIVNALESFLNLSWFNSNRNLFEKVFPMYLEHPKLSFNDCCLAVYAELNGAEPLWTFDWKLSQQAVTARMVE